MATVMDPISVGLGVTIAVGDIVKVLEVRREGCWM